MTNNKKQKRKLEIIVKQGGAFCRKYEKPINLRMYFRHKCYYSNHRGKYCQYFEKQDIDKK